MNCLRFPDALGSGHRLFAKKDVTCILELFFSSLKPHFMFCMAAAECGSA